MFAYLAVAESRRFSRHGGHVEQHERMALVIEVGVGADHARDRIDGKVSVRVTRINGIAGTVGTCQ